ncbi:MAG: DNA repair protein RecN, partial [Syntrophothermus sp.]
TEVIRKGAQKAVVEGIFDVSNNAKVRNLLEETDIEFQDELIMRREISLKGSNRCFLNDTPVTLAQIKEAGNLLVDLHGQHEHQSLLRTETHIEMLDDFGSLEKILIEYRNDYHNLNRLIHQLKALREKEEVLKEKKELYSFQIREIDSVNPVENEDEKLTQELKILENSEHLLEATNAIYQNIYESENAVYDALVSVKNALHDLARIDKSFMEVEAECQTSLTLINDISEFVRNYSSRIDIEPERLEEVRDRLGALIMLKKKYGGSLDAVLVYRQKIGLEYDEAENFEDKIKGLEADIEKIKVKCSQSAVKVSQRRRELALKVQKEVVSALNFLGIENSVFDVRITHTPATLNEPHLVIDGKPYKYDVNGYDCVEFFISTNIGEDPKPLVKVASGGEISRIMLALKTILAKNDKLPLLIFDEIDTGVSGRIAQKVGQTLKDLAKFHQIISITHLPQIAGMAGEHFLVQKELAGERVVSSIRKLNETERVREVAKLMSGEKVTEASLKGARELMGITE